VPLRAHFRRCRGQTSSSRTCCAPWPKVVQTFHGRSAGLPQVRPSWIWLWLQWGVIFSQVVVRPSWHARISECCVVVATVRALSLEPWGCRWHEDEEVNKVCKASALPLPFITSSTGCRAPHALYTLGTRQGSLAIFDFLMKPCT